uniref:Uncharacterized protein n=1 Tax=Candidatus Methanophaga sp. ANME-1 ERB7 TaxID=2759913 RepID=A0A7G9Z299_9EURY|nr:hypothetical protein NMFEFIAP_00009 [Methanosarcinales archaeon ANME-1 ERB7]
MQVTKQIHAIKIPFQIFVYLNHIQKYLWYPVRFLELIYDLGNKHYDDKSSAHDGHVKRGVRYMDLFWREKTNEHGEQRS